MQYHAIPCNINNCWRSVPLPCGQYNGHFWITIQKICNQQGLVLVSVSAKCQRTCMYFPHNPENITKAKILYWGWEKERLCSPGFNLYGRVPFQSGLRARRELDPLILSSWSIFCTSFLCMEPLTKHFDHMITLDIQMQSYYIQNLCNQNLGYHQNSPCLHRGGLEARQFWFDVHSFVFAWYVFRSKSSIPRLSVSLLMSGSIKSSLGPNSRFAKRTSYPHPSVHLSVSRLSSHSKSPIHPNQDVLMDLKVPNHKHEILVRGR